MNRKDNMYLEQVMVKIAKFSQNLLKFPKKLQKYEGGQGLLDNAKNVESQWKNDKCWWRFVLHFFGQEINIDSFGQEINIDKSHVAHIPMSELRQLKMMCGVTSNWKRLSFPDRRAKCKFFISLISKPSLIKIGGYFFGPWESQIWVDQEKNYG